MLPSTYATVLSTLVSGEALLIPMDMARVNTCYVKYVTFLVLPWDETREKDLNKMTCVTVT